MSRRIFVLSTGALLTLLVLAGGGGNARTRLPVLAASAVATSTPQPSQPASAYPTVAIARVSARSYSLGYAGAAVNFDLSGLEPDFDPIYKVIVSTTLHDERARAQALPDATLILSAYLEVFQPDTTPILPDLLHPDQVANNLAGFLSGAAALVNAGGTVVYRGSLVAEVFQDSTEHLVVDLTPLATSPGTATVRLQGTIILHKGGGESGTLTALAPLSRPALAVSRGHLPSWQTVVNGLSVHTPTMMGTAGTPGKQAPARPATIAPMAPTTPAPSGCDLGCRLRRPITLVPLGLGGVLLLFGVLLGWSRLARRGGAGEKTTPPPLSS